jgi:predicted dehydrogenase
MFHLPALAKNPELTRSLILVDRDLPRARAICERLGAADAVADHREVMDRVAGAIIATPHHLHYPITMDFVRAGVHVLSEKPLAETAAQVDDIVTTAARQNVQVAVNHTRRFFKAFREIRRVIESGELGEIKEINYELGEPFQWPAATDTYFGVKAGGRGVLFDTGAHIIDLVCWWMGGQPELVTYADDSHGGTEAVARVVLRSGQTTARVQLSWLSKLRNTYNIIGTRGSIEGGVYEWSSFTLKDARGKARKVRADVNTRVWTDFGEMLIANFANVVAGREKPVVSAADARTSIAIIDECYAQRSRVAEPWHDAFEVLSHV